MLAISLAALLLLGAPQHFDASQRQSQPDSSPPPVQHDVVAIGAAHPAATAFQKKIAVAPARYEPIRQAAIRINDMAGNLHSEKDVRALVDAIAEEVTHHRHLAWAALGIRHRVARAEYAAVSDPSYLIPEQRLVDVWNEYMREIDAPAESPVTSAEIHALRIGHYRASRFFWSRGFGQSIWDMPNLYAVDETGAIADGCRPLESLDILYGMHNLFQNVLSARERLQKGAPLPDATSTSTQFSSRLVASSSVRVVSFSDPIRPAEILYQQDHGESEYRHLLLRLFNELIPAE